MTSSFERKKLKVFNEMDFLRVTHASDQGKKLNFQVELKIENERIPSNEK